MKLLKISKNMVVALMVVVNSLWHLVQSKSVISDCTHAKNILVTSFGGRSWISGGSSNCRMCGKTWKAISISKSAVGITVSSVRISSPMVVRHLVVVGITTAAAIVMTSVRITEGGTAVGVVETSVGIVEAGGVRIEQVGFGLTLLFSGRRQRGCGGWGVVVRLVVVDESIRHLASIEHELRIGLGFGFSIGIGGQKTKG